jgi:hypothetical protein
VDPISLALGIGTGVGGLAGGLYQTTANNRLQKRNNARIAALEDLERRGALGLTPVQQRQLSNQLLAPMQAQAAEQRTRSEQLAGAMGASGASGADLATLRTEQARQGGAAANQVAAQVRAADEAKAQGQRQELEARLQSQAEMKQNDIETALRTIAQSAGAGGALAASPESALRQTLTSLSGQAAGTQAAPPNPFLLSGGAPGSVPPESLLPSASVQQLRTAGYSDGEIVGLADVIRRNPALLQQYINQRMLGADLSGALGALP